MYKWRFLTNDATLTESGVDLWDVRRADYAKWDLGGLVEKLPLYVQLMNEGHTNSAACRMLGVHRNTGNRWLHGRNGVEGLRQQGLDPANPPTTDRHRSRDSTQERRNLLSAGESPGFPRR